MIRVFFAALAVTIAADVFDSIPVTNEIPNSFCKYNTFCINESFLFLSLIRFVCVAYSKRQKKLVVKLNFLVERRPLETFIQEQTISLEIKVICTNIGVCSAVYIVYKNNIK